MKKWKIVLHRGNKTMNFTKYERIEALEEIIEDCLLLEMEYRAVLPLQTSRGELLKHYMKEPEYQAVYHTVRRGILSWQAWAVNAENVSQNNRQYFSNKLLRELKG